jgi:hypothetical protein
MGLPAIISQSSHMWPVHEYDCCQGILLTMAWHNTTSQRSVVRDRKTIGNRGNRRGHIGCDIARLTVHLIRHFPKISSPTSSQASQALLFNAAPMHNAWCSGLSIAVITSNVVALRVSSERKPFGDIFRVFATGRERGRFCCVAFAFCFCGSGCGLACSCVLRSGFSLCARDSFREKNQRRRLRSFLFCDVVCEMCVQRISRE